MPKETPLQRTKRLAVASGTTAQINMFDHMCKMKPHRLGIVVEGDSWVKYPRSLYFLGRDMNLCHHLIEAVNFTDTVNMLNIGKNGDTAANMFSDKGIAPLKRVLAKHAKHIDMLLISAGGNDIVGYTDMLSLLNAPDPSQNDFLDHVNSRMDSILENYQKLLEVCKELVPAAKIFTHTYDLVKPSPIGPVFIGIKFGSSWIHRAMVEKEVPEAFRQPIVKYMLETFADRMALLAADPATEGRLIVVDTQGNLRPGHPADWENEIHPTSTGFAKIFNEIYGEMQMYFPELP